VRMFEGPRKNVSLGPAVALDGPAVIDVKPIIQTLGKIKHRKKHFWKCFVLVLSHTTTSLLHACTNSTNSYSITDQSPACELTAEMNTSLRSTVQIRNSDNANRLKQ